MRITLSGLTYIDYTKRRYSIAKDRLGKHLYAGSIVNNIITDINYTVCYRYGNIVLKSNFSGWYSDLNSNEIELLDSQNTYKGDGLIIVGDSREDFFRHGRLHEYLQL